MNRWRSQEIASNNANNSAIKSLRILSYNKTSSSENDDYSFDPIGIDNGYNGNAIPRYYNDGNDQFSRGDNGQQHQSREETVSFDNQIPPSSLFMSPIEKGPSYHEDEKQNVFAPPGKVGVAIDVINGQPVVHKIKRGSPLEGKLQPNDIVVAIDDVDTTCMSAADVTHLMVKRMNYQRKITFVRK